MQLNGVFTALATIFDLDNKIDWEAMKDLIEFQINSGINGLLVCGSTGEAATLSDAEKFDLINFAIQLVNKKIPIIVGVNYNSTDHAIHQAKIYEDLGADILLVNNPSYNKPSENGIFAHFEAIAKEVTIPIIIYNIPSRSIFDLSNNLILRLLAIKNIIGVKDSTGQTDRCHFLKKHANDAILFGGDDNIGLFYCINGGCGVISVLSNLLPKQIAHMYKDLGEKKYEEAFDMHKQLMDLYSSMFIETNPIPVKYALHLTRGYSEKVRLPLLELQESSKKLIKNQYAHIVDLVENQQFLSPKDF